jgi:hypothetical protein
VLLLNDCYLINHNQRLEVKILGPVVLQESLISNLDEHWAAVIPFAVINKSRQFNQLPVSCRVNAYLAVAVPSELPVVCPVETFNRKERIGKTGGHVAGEISIRNAIFVCVLNKRKRYKR